MGPGSDALPLSGIPPEAWLSGLPLGALSPDGTLSGSPGEVGRQPGLPEMQGGLSLAELSELLGQEQQTGPGTSASLFGGLGDFSLGQGPGYLTAGGTLGSSEQPRGQGGYATAGGQQGDPLMLIRAALGLGGKVAGVGEQISRSRQGYGTAGPQSSAIDPTGFSLTQEGAGSEPQDLFSQSLGQQPISGTSSFGDPSLGMLFTKGLLEGNIDPSWVSSLPTEDQQRLLASLVTGEEGPLLSASDFDLGDTTLFGNETSQVGYGTGLAPEQQNAEQGGSLFGAAGGGIQSGLGLLNLLYGLEGDNIGATAGGGLQTASGLVKLLESSPEFAEALGLSGATLGGASTALGGLGGLLGLYGGAQAFKEGNVPAGITGTVGGGLSTYGALSTLFPSVFPSLGSAAAGLGAGAGAAGAAGAGGAATGAAGAGAAAGTGAAVGSSIAGAIAWPLLPVALGVALHPLFSAMAQPSLEERNERRGNTALAGWSKALLDATGQADSIPEFLALAGAGPNIGQGQIRMSWNGYGGGDYDDPASPEYMAALQRAGSGDQAGIMDFIKGFDIKTGRTGLAEENLPFTDFFRREMARVSGIDPKTEGLFPDWDPRSAQNLTGNIGDYGALEKLIGQGFNKAPWSPGEAYGQFAGGLQVPISSYGRTDSDFMLDPARTAVAQRELELLKMLTQNYQSQWGQGVG